MYSQKTRTTCKNRKQYLYLSNSTLKLFSLCCPSQERTIIQHKWLKPTPYFCHLGCTSAVKVPATPFFLFQYRRNSMSSRLPSATLLVDLKKHSQSPLWKGRITFFSTENQFELSFLLLAVH